ncbi:DUF262 domain-containing protein [uncultured Acinetobacter sp.]|uniref:DUF262 domain-containing protein n=1 Tax=uncultured Acinetobacter sp. TaxID=165433 RepID=UPI00258E24AF|nr:DUF262 domain-containing protein [uncultured Acinetobacter sp.]
MRLTPSDPDIATLYRKISTGRLDLQPNFQRGEVWGKVKKQRLIDSIIRKWHVPPIHVIQSKSTDKQEVLDGQQRLVAIRDFIDGEFPVNGKQNPLDETLEKLDGLYWKNLPEEIKSQIEDFTIRILTIEDYEVDEPGELFYRLNQPTNLTSAEQRNAFFGDTRQQVKDLSMYMEEILEFGHDSLGYSNSRMAYDDVLAKFLIIIELNTLKKKITANTVTARYRDGQGFSSNLIKSTTNVLDQLHDLLNNSTYKIRLNKATTLSWMLFIYAYIRKGLNINWLKKFFYEFESFKRIKEQKIYTIHSDYKYELLGDYLIGIYLDRASARVADTMSVILRDFVLWATFYSLNKVHDNSSELISVLNSLENKKIDDSILENLALQLNWGVEL